VKGERGECEAVALEVVGSTVSAIGRIPRRRPHRTIERRRAKLEQQAALPSRLRGGSDWNAQARTSTTTSTFASHSPTAKNRKGERRQKVRTSAGRTGVTPKRDRLENGKSRQRGAASVC